ncbi:MAG TPA: DUF2017 family protein [Verrucomicrobiae bacterium]|jgi:hypothetical protein
MKFLPGKKSDALEQSLAFSIDAREEGLLLAILRLYPVLPASHHRLTKDPKSAAAAEQRLLEESMAQQKAAHKRKLDELFLAPQRYFKDGPEGQRRLALTRSQFEWLLQVLNDIRVGHWVRLGCPDLDQTPPVAANRANARALQIMQLSGAFQSALLEAVR